MQTPTSDQLYRRTLNCNDSASCRTDWREQWSTFRLCLAQRECDFKAQCKANWQTLNGDRLYCKTLKGNDRAQSAVACVKRGAGGDEASDGASAQRMAYGLCRCGWIAMRRVAARSTTVCNASLDGNDCSNNFPIARQRPKDHHCTASRAYARRKTNCKH